MKSARGMAGMDRVHHGNAMASPLPTRRRRSRLHIGQARGARHRRDSAVRDALWFALAAAFTVAVLLLLPRHARGAERGAIVVPCGDRAGAARLFAGRYGETPLLEGLTTNGARAELFAGRTRTWSFVVTDAEGRTCLLAAGTALGPAITIEPEGETP